MKKVVCTLISTILLLSMLSAAFAVSANPVVTNPSVIITMGDDIDANPAEEITIPVTCTKNGGLWGAQFEIYYDPSILTVIVQGTNEVFDTTDSTFLPGNYSLFQNYKSTGQITANITGINLQDYTVTGKIFDLKFRLRANLEECDIPIVVEYTANNCISSNKNGEEVPTLITGTTIHCSGRKVHYNPDGDGEGNFIVKNGVKDTSFNGFFSYQGRQYFVVSGDIQNVSGLFKNPADGKYYLLEKGAQTTKTLLYKYTDGKWYYVKNGVVTKSTLLFKHTDKKWYYVKNGVVTKATLLFKHTDKKYYYVKNGVVAKATLLFKHTDKKYYYVKNGVVTKANLLFKHTDKKYYYVKNGVVTKATLLFKHTDKKYYYIKNGVATKATLLFKHTDKKWYYVKSGVMTKATLIYKFNGAKRYIKAGVWQSGFTGKVKISGKTYNIKKGNVV